MSTDRFTKIHNYKTHNASKTAHNKANREYSIHNGFVAICGWRWGRLPHSDIMYNALESSKSEH